MLRRRDFLGLLASAVAARPLPVLAQHPTKAVVGFIHAAAPVYFDAFRNAFLAGLKEAGYVEQDNLSIEWRWAEGHYERLPALIADLLQRNVNVLFAAGGTDPARVAEGRYADNADCFCQRCRPRCDRSRHKSQQAWRQRHRREPARIGVERQEIRVAA
jgi:hypothetical protein